MRTNYLPRFLALALGLAALAVAAPAEGPAIAVAEFETLGETEPGAGADLARKTVELLREQNARARLSGGLFEPSEEAPEPGPAAYLVTGKIVRDTFAGGEIVTLRALEADTAEILFQASPAKVDAATVQNLKKAIDGREAWLDERPEENSPRIVVKWGIESATDNFGYIVHRAEGAGSEDYAPITRRMLPGVGTTSVPHVFRYIDQSVEMGTTYSYKVEEVARDGARSFFKDPRTNETMVLRGQPKRLSNREARAYGEEPFHADKLER